nr:hypothetical protein CFP56_43944 [Quercus suber]
MADRGGGGDDSRTMAFTCLQLPANVLNECGEMAIVPCDVSVVEWWNGGGGDDDDDDDDERGHILKSSGSAAEVPPDM